MNAAVVCPNDYSTVNFCKGLLYELKNRKGIQNTYAICDTYGENTSGHYTRVLASWGVRPISLAINRFISPWEDIRYTYALYKIFRREKIGVVVNISTKPNIYGTIAARLAGARVVLCAVWGRGRVFAPQNGIKAALLKKVLLGMYRLAFRLSTKTWFTNQNDLDFFLKHNLVSRGKTILTKNYVNTSDYRPVTLPDETRKRLQRELDLDESDKVVVMVGRMIWAKGVKEFIEAAGLLKKELPGVKFILVGPEEPGSPDAIPSDYLKSNKKTENFRWIGFRKDVPDLYALSELAVLPSYYNEGGYPRALTEPMAMGKPVIAADTVDCRSPVEPGRNGYRVPPKNPRALAEAISALMQDDLKRREFGAHSRFKATSEYDENVIVKGVLNDFFAEVSTSV